MEGINQIIKIPAALSREAVKAKQTRGPEAQVTAPVAHPVPAEDLKQAAAEVDKLLEKQHSDLSVSVDESSGTLVVRITDNTTGEVVKQIPPEQLMEANVSMNKIVGLLMDDQG
ncbi:MAG: flagellar protein FlaG [Candidatus Handelsmanbacteria bacterium]|nr:flagellar protein FlaG [Candidatus Handelsmanbacteria bacterium]